MITWNNDKTFGSSNIDAISYRISAGSIGPEFMHILLIANHNKPIATCAGSKERMIMVAERHEISMESNETLDRLESMRKRIDAAIDSLERVVSKLDLL